MRKTALAISLLAFLLGFCGPRVKRGPNWEKIATLKGKGNVKVELTSPKEKYSLGEEITFTVETNKDGYLWLGYVNSKDKISVIYPLGEGDEHAISAKTPFKIPPEDSDWKIKASPPAGDLLIFAVVCEKDVPLRHIIPFIATEKELNLSKDIHVGAKPDWGIATLVIKIKEEKK